MRAICVFCGSSIGALDSYRDQAVQLGKEFAKRHIRLVYGGGKVGLMGVIADSVLEADGEVVGIIPESLLLKEVEHRGLTELIITQSMHERKARMESAADGFIALPGGFGTFDELCEILTWAQLGLHAKPVGILNTHGFFDQLTSFLDFVTDQGFIRPEHRSLLLSAPEPGALLDRLAAWEPTTVPKWTSMAV